MYARPSIGSIKNNLNKGKRLNPISNESLIPSYVKNQKRLHSVGNPKGFPDTMKKTSISYRRFFHKICFTISLIIRLNISQFYSLSNSF